MPETRGRFSDIIVRSELINETVPRLLRGGSFYYLQTGIRSAVRSAFAPSVRISNFGCRPARTFD